jgi:uncharacterized protein (DUF58 family)
LNLARLNHILIPNTKEDRDRFRRTRFARLAVQPLARTWFALTDEGRGLLALSMLASLSGLDVIRGQNHLLWAFSFSLLVASLMVRPLFRIRGLRIGVDGPARVSVGGEARFRIELANHGERDIGSLRLRRPFLPWDGSWLGGDDALPGLPVGERVVASAVGRFVARGRHHIDPFGAAALVPLGLAVGPVKESRGARFVVVPRIARIDRLALPERPRHQQGGVTLASQTGESMELVGLRPWRDGDHPRDLHARSWARLGTPVVREYQQEYFTRIGVVLDAGEVAGDERALEAVVSLAAGLVARLDRGESLIDLIVLGDPRGPLTVGRSLGRLDDALDRLAEVTAGEGFDPEASARSVDPVLDRLSALIFVSPAWDPARRDFVAGLRERGVACRCLVVAEPDPQAPRPDGPEVQQIGVTRIEAAGSDGAGLAL